MNNQFNRLFVLLFLVLGSFTLGNAAVSITIDKGGEMVIIDKTGTTVLEISLPNEYVKGTELQIPATVSIFADGKTIYSNETGTTEVILPKLDVKAGTSCQINIAIGKYNYSQTVTW